mmetsp:Transcript_21151/g.54218  ORF Transcript_21151/g.54218 Transcript_21151/m.54218 type:complete len:209 (-) Transcript_21151:1214-1840(-)
MGRTSCYFRAHVVINASWLAGSGLPGVHALDALRSLDEGVHVHRVQRCLHLIPALTEREVRLHRQLALLRALVPGQAPLQRGEPVARGILRADGRHRVLAHLDENAVAALQLLARFAVKADPGGAARILRDAQLDLGVVRHDDGPEGERVRADGREQDGADVWVHHGAACCYAVGGAASGRGQQHAVRLHLGDQLPLLVALDLGEVGV